MIVVIVAGPLARNELDDRFNASPVGSDSIPFTRPR